MSNLKTYVKIVVYHNNELLGSDSMTLNNEIYNFEFQMLSKTKIRLKQEMVSLI
jgi:hypothetical protein